jgi:hypothetical protein
MEYPLKVFYLHKEEKKHEEIINKNDQKPSITIFVTKTAVSVDICFNLNIYMCIYEKKK